MSNFVAQLAGGARVVDGRLLLGGNGSCLIANDRDETGSATASIGSRAILFPLYSPSGR
jgi:hypothetical protein